MPQPGLRWRQVVLNTHNSWLPGEPRGFRSYEHKIHSSGDYKNPPPPGEHAGLFLYSKAISGDPVLIPEAARKKVDVAILNRLKKMGYGCLAIAVSGMHTHFQAELPDDLPTIRHIIGQCKSKASHAIRDVLPGRVWGRDGSYNAIDDPDYQRNVFQYILDQKDAWIWCYKDPWPEDDYPEENPQGSRCSPSGVNDEE